MTHLLLTLYTVIWTPPPGIVQGYKVYVNNKVVATGTATSARINIGDWSTNTAWVTAYNVSGESGASNKITFKPWWVR